MHTWVYYPNGNVRQIKNLGYLLRNWKDVKQFVVGNVVRPLNITKKPHMNEYLLQVYFDDGRLYETTWMDKDSLWEWLKRPVFIGLPLHWFGKDYVISKG